MKIQLGKKLTYKDLLYLKSISIHKTIHKKHFYQAKGKKVRKIEIKKKLAQMIADEKKDEERNSWSLPMEEKRISEECKNSILNLNKYFTEMEEIIVDELIEELLNAHGTNGTHNYNNSSDFESIQILEKFSNKTIDYSFLENLKYHFF